jgi:uncharacterized repeat protein (TIGR03803 family)
MIGNNRWKTIGAIFVLCAVAAIAAPAQVFTTLSGFDCGNGCFPYFVTPVQGTDGKLYGTTAGGNRPSYPGTTFSVTTLGVMTVLDTFCGSCQGGDSPNAGLVLDTDGNFYGTTSGMDATNDGTAFKMNAKAS